jgi:hypothetical protein
MQLRSLTVSGFGPFENPLAFGPLDPVNVLYGSNNGGKSSLLQAVELYFRLLGASEGITRAQTQILDNLDDDTGRLIQRSAKNKITFSAEWHIPESALEAGGLQPDRPFSKLVTVLEVQNLNRTYDLRVQKWILDTEDFAELDRDQNKKAVQLGTQLRRLISDAMPFQFDKPVLPWAWLGASPELFPRSLRDRLFDARQSTDQRRRRRWAVFARLAGSFRHELGEGTWETTFDRSTGAADILFLRDDRALTLEVLGAGVQRLAGLLAELCLAEAPCICIEEPECRLSPDLQRRLMEMVDRVLEAKLGPRQLFLTTHSPMIAACGSAFELRAEAGPPVLERKPWAVSEVGESSNRPGLGKLIGIVEGLASIDPEHLAAPAHA